MSESVAVIGAGLVGCLSAIALAKRGYRVTVFDYRKDPRDKSTTERNLRSINLAISSRGISSLEFIDKEMAERVLKDIIPMRGRMIHHLDGKQESQIYGLFGETINSIDRAVLNNYLLDELDRFDNDKVQLKFGHKLTKIKFRDSEEFQSCIFTTDEGVDRVYGVNFIVGCDGSYSTTRDQMQREVRMRYSQEYIDCCYIELYIPPSETYVEEFKGNFSIAPDHLHIWPRHKFMLIALANKDGSFTSTFFGPWKLVESLLQSKSAVKAFLEDNFPDAMDIMGLENAVECFMGYPKGALMCVECEPYHVPGGRCIILGDAAHSMVPFYGQGMNCGFEDVKVLMKLLDSNHGDRTKAFDAYTERRHRDLTAIIRLAIRNYTEMSHDVTSVSFLLKKKIDGLLGRLFKDRWLPLYTMVSFRADIPYHKAVAIAKRQDKILGFIQAILIASISVIGYKAFRVFYSRIRRLKR